MGQITNKFLSEDRIVKNSIFVSLYKIEVIFSLKVIEILKDTSHCNLLSHTLFYSFHSSFSLCFTLAIFYLLVFEFIISVLFCI